MIDLLIPFVISGGDYKIKKNREEDTKERLYMDGKVKIMTYHNRGALLNLGQKYPKLVLITSIALTGAILINYLVNIFHKGSKMLIFGLGMLLGGAFSNTYDRYSKGFVTDYLNFPKAPLRIRNVIFNLSDFAIIIGALISVFKSEK